MYTYINKYIYIYKEIHTYMYDPICDRASPIDLTGLPPACRYQGRWQSLAMGCDLKYRSSLPGAAS